MLSVASLMNCRVPRRKGAQSQACAGSGAALFLQRVLVLFVKSFTLRQFKAYGIISKKLVRLENNVK